MKIADLLKIKKTYKNINRITQILNVFVKHGFGQFIEMFNLSKLIPFSKRIKMPREGAVAGVTIAASLREAFSELGPSFIKLGQLLSSRPDLISDQYAQEFEKLQDEIPPFNFDIAKKIIEAEINKPIDEVFASIEEIPLAAASIAQVHAAKLIDGTKVVIKVQRPNIKGMVETDIGIMKIMATLMVKYLPETETFNPVGIVEEYAKTIKKELSFIEEARNLKRAAKNFKNLSKVKIPEIFPQYSSDKIIVMERFEGIRINDLTAIEKNGFSRHEIAKNLVDAYLKMILDDGFFHADPHPGNLFILEDGSIGIVDFGMAAMLTPDVMESIATMFVAFIKKDFHSIIDQFIVIGMVTEEKDVDRFRQEFMTDLMEILMPLYESSITEINFSEYLDTITHLALKHKLKIPTSLIMIDKCMLIIESIVRELDPEFSVIQAASPYTSVLLRKRYGPKRLYDKLNRHLNEVGDSLIDTPKKLRVLLRRMINNDFSIKMNFIGIERLIRDLDRSTNRLSFSIVVASIIMSSSILTLSGVGGKIFDMPAIGTLGFMMAFVLGVWLIISILRSGRF
ncbi:unusual protein kinase [Candidatus Magnetoovum chiemensis]|nr:unusual protein kinase [Candidatus Magnetoovum chiemensis]